MFREMTPVMEVLRELQGSDEEDILVAATAREKEFDELFSRRTEARTRDVLRKKLLRQAAILERASRDSSATETRNLEDLFLTFDTFWEVSACVWLNRSNTDDPALVADIEAHMSMREQFHEELLAELRAVGARTWLFMEAVSHR